jgi:hypothetical protein
MTGLSTTLTHGLRYFWSYLAVAALAGAVLAWAIARRRARRRAAAALDDLGPPLARLEDVADGELAVVTGQLEIDGGRSLVQDPADGEPAGAGDGSEPAVFLRVGGTRVALRGDVDVRVGSRERWGLLQGRVGAVPAARVRAGSAIPGAKGPRSRLHPLRRWLAQGQAVRARGIVGAGPAPGRMPRQDRALLPQAGGRLELVAERRPRVRLHPGTIVVSLAVASAVYVGAVYVAGSVGAHEAWELARGQRSEAQARRAIRWAGLGGLSPFHRDRSIDAIRAALDVSDLADPEAQGDLVHLAAAYESELSGTCRQTLGRIAGRANHAFVAELAELCGDDDSLVVAARARLAAGEVDRAADLLGRTGATEGRRVLQLELERAAFLLAGRLEAAAATIRLTQARIDEEYMRLDDEEPDAWRERTRGVLGCAADQLSARAGDRAARARLLASSADSSSPPRVRWTCALLLADLAGGAERLALADRIRGDARDDEAGEGFATAGRLDLEPIERNSLARWRWSRTHRPDHATTLDLLELEADPSRVRPSRAADPVLVPADILAGEVPVEPVDAVKWAALERLAAIADPPPPLRRQRAALAVELVAFASLLGDHETALRWMAMAERDREVLVRDPAAGALDVVALGTDELAMRRAYVELRAGRPVTGPIWSTQGRPTRDVAERRVELEGVLDFVERGMLDRLREPGSGLRFARRPPKLYGIFEGLQVATRGSGDELVRWLERLHVLDLDTEGIGVPVALVGAHRIRTGKPAMLEWLRRTRPSPYEPFIAKAVGAANRARIAEALGDRAVAARHRAEAAGWRRALLRRDTALVRRLLDIR